MIRSKVKYISPIFYGCDDVMKLLGVSDRKAYEVIRHLNDQLKEQGFIIIAGRVPRQFFHEHFYCNQEVIKDVING